MYEYTCFKVCNVSNQFRRGQNKTFWFSKYLTDEEIRNFIIRHFGQNKDYKLIKRREIVENALEGANSQGRL